jgi:hypothetical protein
MFPALISIIFFPLHTAYAEIVKTENYVMYPARAGVGDIMGHISDMSLLSCGLECSISKSCTSANYEPTNRTCTLLYVDEVQDDWLDAQDNIYMCANSQVDFTGELTIYYEVFNIREAIETKSDAVYSTLDGCSRLN